MTTARKTATKTAAKRTTRRTAKKPEQANHFDLHEHYKSIEEFELEMSRIAEVMQQAMEAIHDLKVPLPIKYGLVQSTVDAYFETMSTATERVKDVKTIIELVRQAEGVSEDE